MKNVFWTIFWLVALYLFLLTAPTPGIDCSRYHQNTFYGVRVNCDKAGGK